MREGMPSFEPKKDKPAEPNLEQHRPFGDITPEEISAAAEAAYVEGKVATYTDRVTRESRKRAAGEEKNAA